MNGSLNNYSIAKTLKIWKLLMPRRRRQVFFLLILTLLVSVVEIVSIGLVLPFLSLLTNPEVLFDHPMVVDIREVLNIGTHGQLVLYITFVFIAALVVSSMLRILHLWVLARVSNAIGSDLSYKIYGSFLKKSYGEISSINSSEIISTVLTKVDRVVLQIIIPMLNIASSLIISIFILSAIIFLSPLISIAVVLLIGLMYAAILIATRKRLLVNSEYISRSSDRMVQLIQESRGSIKDVILGGLGARYCSKFRDLDWRYRYKQGVNLTINQGPRFIVEALSVSLIVVLSYILTMESDDPKFVLPILGVLVFGMQKLLPLFQVIYRSWSMIQGGMASFTDVVHLMQDTQMLENTSGQENTELSFQNDVLIKQVSFRYDNKQSYVFRDVSLKMEKGSCVGVVGESGSGKTTLIDLIMGLLEPCSGELQIDGTPISQKNIVAWRQHISHVPQEVFLADASIAENVALGFSEHEIDKSKLKKCIERAQLKDLIDSLPERESTTVGEMGSLLSGGQRQRIAIARALYSDADVFVFDEATSALDGETEKEIVDVLMSIKSNVLLIMVSHNLKMLEMCDQVVDISNLNKSE